MHHCMHSSINSLTLFTFSHIFPCEGKIFHAHQSVDILGLQNFLALHHPHPRFSASSYRTSFQNVNARLAMLVNLLGFSVPSTFLLVSIICAPRTSTSIYRLLVPVRRRQVGHVRQRVRILASSILMLVSITCRLRSSFNFQQLWFL